MIIALEGPSVGQVLWCVSGVSAAFSPCGSFIAVAEAGEQSRSCLWVLRLSARQVVSSWSPSLSIAELPQEWHLTYADLCWTQSGRLPVVSAAGNASQENWFVAELEW